MEQSRKNMLLSTLSLSLMYSVGKKIHKKLQGNHSTINFSVKASTFFIPVGRCVLYNNAANL